MILHDHVMDFHILDGRSERCLEPEVAVCLPAIGGKRVQVLQPASESVIACFAFELEQDIAALEAEAKRGDEASWDCFVVDDTVEGSRACTGDHAVREDMDHYHPHEATDSDSEDDTDLEDDAAARIHANARMVAACGRPVQQGAWKGCTKSAWCDREDRHRGLCNHKASIPGPAACPVPHVTPCNSKQQQDTVDCEGPGASCGAQQSAAPVSSGEHSLCCKPAHKACDEREVASALKHGSTMDNQPSMEDTSMPFSCLPAQGCEHVVSVAATAPLPEAFWTSSSADDEQFIAMPAAYQPLVKDLEAPCIGNLLQADGLCYMDETLDVPVPVVQPLVQAREVVQYASTSSDDSACDSLFKPGLSPQSACSAPSSPSCASEGTNMTFDDAAAALAAAALAVPAIPAPACLPHAVPAPQGIITASSVTLPAASFVLPDMLPLEEVHPASCMQTVSAAPPEPAEGGSSCTAQQYDIAAHISNTGSQVMDSSGDDCKEACDVQEAVPAAAVVDVPAAAANPVAAVDAKIPVMQRAPRIKVKPRRADDPPRPLLEPSSPKCKKRVAGRLAAHPSSGHCCTQCGAVSTPVWRAGPAGPKTLCNACGVRYMKVARRK